MLVVVGLSIGVRFPERSPLAEAASERSVPAEEIVYVPVPESPAAPTAAPSPTSAIDAIVRRPAAPRGEVGPGNAPSGVLQAPATLFPTPPRPDSARRPAGTAPSVPTPRAVFTPAPCPAPCLEKGGAPRTVGGAGVLANGKTLPPLTREQRDSVLRGIAAEVARAPRVSSSPVGPKEPSPMGQPPQQTGASIPIGLPGGGPTRAQRKRDSILNAEVEARLERVKARADSIEAARRDSIARAQRTQRTP